MVRSGLAASRPEQPFAHHGLLFEPEIGSYQNRARQYDLGKRRFNQMDPREFIDTFQAYFRLATSFRPLEPLLRELNLFEYQLGNAVSNRDPLGLTCELNGPWGHIKGYASAVNSCGADASREACLDETFRGLGRRRCWFCTETPGGRFPYHLAVMPCQENNQFPTCSSTRGCGVTSIGLNGPHECQCQCLPDLVCPIW